MSDFERTRFHFKIDNETYIIINKFKDIFQTENKSVVINKILSKCEGLVEKFIFVNDFEVDFPDEVNIKGDIFVSIDDRFMNLLFLFQDIFHTRSKGVILRTIIKLFYRNVIKFKYFCLCRYLWRLNKILEIRKKKNFGYINIFAHMSKNVNANYLLTLPPDHHLQFIKTNISKPP